MSNGVPVTTRRAALGGALMMAICAPANARQWVTAPDVQPVKPGQAKTLESRLPAVLNIKDFGAFGDGKTDDTTAYEACRQAAVSGDRPVVVPDGRYLIHGRVLSAEQVTKLGLTQ